MDPSRLTLVMVANPQTVKAQLADLPIGELEVRQAPSSAEPAAATAPKPADAAPAAPAKKKKSGGAKK